MIPIIVVILKIIGWLLLILVSLFLCLIGIVLFAPIRYRFDLEYEKNLEGSVKVTWLSHIISVQANCQENRVQYQVRLFGVLIFPKKKKHKVNKKDKTREKTTFKKKEKAPEVIGHLSSPEETKENKKKTEEKKTPEKTQGKKENQTIQKENIQEVKLPVRIEKENPKKQRKKGIWNQIKEKWNQIKQFVKRVRDSFYSIPKKIKNMSNRLDFIRQKVKYYREFYKDEVTQRAIQFTKKLLKKMCLHTLPRKFEGKVIFGTDDPALTGQILGILSMGMPFYKEKLTVCPIFNESIFEFKIKGKGRIQFGYYIYLGLKFWFHKDVKQVIARVRKEFKKVN